jgi:hypothetical protein
MFRKLTALMILALALILPSKVQAQYNPSTSGKSTFTNTGGGGLDAFYAALRQSNTQIVRIVSFGDSIITCYQITPCTDGPYNAANSPVLALRNEFLKQYVQYSTGLRIPFRLMPTATVDGGEGGYTLTSGSVSESTVFGPQQSGYSLNGSALLTITSDGVLTINVGQGFNRINIYCVETASNTGWAVTIGGTSVGTACGTTSSTTIGVVQQFSNTTVTTGTASSWSISGNVLTVTTVASGSFAVGGVLSGTAVTSGTTITQQLTGTAGGAGTYLLSASSTASSGTLTQTGGLVNSAVTLTASGASSYLGGYEAITTTGNTGVVVDNMGEGAISSAFWTGATGLGWFNLLAGQPALCILEDGENDAQNPGVITPAGVVTNLQTVATACQNAGASIELLIPTPYNSTTANQYAWIQLAEWQYAQNPSVGYPWDVINLADAWVGTGVTGVSGTGGNPNFIAQDSAANIAQDVSNNLLWTDSQHPTDYGSCLITRQIFQHLSGGRTTYPCNWYSQTATPANVAMLVAVYTNATTGFTPVTETTTPLHPWQFPIAVSQQMRIRCEISYAVSATTDGIILEVTGPGTPTTITQLFNWWTTATASSSLSLTGSAYAVQIPTSGVATTTATTIFTGQYIVSIYNGTTAGTVAVNAKGVGTGILTIEPGSYCAQE